MPSERILPAILLVSLCGCSGESTPSRPPDQMVYVDLQTRTPVVSEPSDSVPAVNPQTGERSLMPGLYCTACEQWHPAPPLEELQRNPGARQCPQCRGGMSADGPWPEGFEDAE